MSQNFNLGTKAKVCIISLILYPTFLTYIILRSNDINILIQLICLILTMFMAYIMAVIIQDYIYVKKRADKSECRHDVQLLAPLFERHDANV